MFFFYYTYIYNLSLQSVDNVLFTNRQIVGHSLGGGTAALLTYILREHKEFFSTTCVAFAPGTVLLFTK